MCRFMIGCAGRYQIAIRNSNGKCISTMNGRRYTASRLICLVGAKDAKSSATRSLRSYRPTVKMTRSAKVTCER
jgi:hypothetical protein